MTADDIDRPRVHELDRSEQRSYAQLLDIESRIHELSAAIGRRETGLASQRKDERERPQFHYPGRGVKTGDALAEIERDLARDREALSRLVSERDVLSGVWNERKRIATKTRKFAARYLPAGTFDTMTSIIEEGGGR